MRDLIQFLYLVAFVISGAMSMDSKKTREQREFWGRISFSLLFGGVLLGIIIGIVSWLR